MANSQNRFFCNSPSFSFPGRWLTRWSLLGTATINDQTAFIRSLDQEAVREIELRTDFCQDNSGEWQGAGKVIEHHVCQHFVECLLG